jgi:hypothetical protein
MDTSGLSEVADVKMVISLPLVNSGTVSVAEEEPAAALLDALSMETGSAAVARFRGSEPIL